MYRNCDCNYLSLNSAIRERRLEVNIDLLFKIAGIGIIIAVLHQILTKAGREDQAMMTSLARNDYSSYCDY